MMSKIIVAAVFSLATPVYSTEMGVNPIRRVINMLQDMQKTVTEDGEKADELYHKYMCYCETGEEELKASIQAARKLISETGPAIEAKQSKIEVLKKDVAEHKGDRGAAYSAKDEATAIRKKESSAYAKEMAEARDNSDALKQAIRAISDGMGSAAFLQTPSAAAIRNILSKSSDLDSDRQEVLAFLSGEQASDYAPASGEIMGILKQMGEEMAANEDEMRTNEKDALREFAALMAAKRKEVSVLSKMIEEKQDRLGRIGVEIAKMKVDAEDAEESIEEDIAFLKDMKKNCVIKERIHKAEVRSRQDEVVALAQTIKVLNDDDALEIFKKSLPSASSSFVQLQTTSSAMRARAKALVAQVRSKITPAQGRHRLDFIEMAISGKKMGFEKIITLIDGVIAELKKEDIEDQRKKDYCDQEYDLTEDKKKVLTQKVKDLETSIEETRESVLKVTEEIEELKDGIIALDRSVVEATEQRKKENAEYKELMASNGPAKDLILKAKKKLARFYNPEEPKKTEGAASFVQLAARRSEGAPQPPIDTMEAYTKKTEDSNSVTSMMDVLVSDLDKEMVAAKTEEKISQEEYEQMMKDSGEKRAIDAKTIDDKESAKADMKSSLEENRAEEKSSEKELMSVHKYLLALHGECDFLIQYFDARKQARADEVDALQKAKDVLSGADYSLMQKDQKVRLRKFAHQA